MTRFTACLFLFAMIGAVSAHAQLALSVPATGDIVEMAPMEIQLEFTEGLEVAFSIFKLYRLDTDVDTAQANYLQRLNGAAALLVGEALGSSAEDARSIPVTPEPATGLIDTVTLHLDDELPAGHYVVMWRVLSVDTHVIDGFFVFTVGE